jgi:hypothetical protein
MIVGQKMFGEKQCTILGDTNIWYESIFSLVMKFFILNFYFHSFKMQQNEIAFMLI